MERNFVETALYCHYDAASLDLGSNQHEPYCLFFTDFNGNQLFFRDLVVHLWRTQNNKEKSMKSFVFANCAFMDPQFGVMMECAEQLFHQGEKVVLSYCSGYCDVCSANPQGSSAICAFCKMCSHKLRENLSSDIRQIPLKKNKENVDRVFDFHSTEDLKRITYRDVYIGYAVLSHYVSVTRNPQPDFTQDVTQKYFSHLLNLASDLTDKVYELIATEKPDAIHIYNGRMFDNRAFYDVAMKLHIPFFCNEVVGGYRIGEDFKRIVYKESLPHSIETNTRMLHELWAMPNESQDEKIQKGKDFFERRRKGLPAADRVYIKNQNQGELPADWDSSKRNMVIFNSSEDEFCALGKEFDQYSVFSSQLDGIKYILDHVPDPSIHFYIRVHPNLKNVNFAYHMDLYELPKHHSNVTVIPAWDQCSTYDLMDAAEKVIVFGSTIGAEAAYAHKPVILLAGSLYHDLNISHNPSTAKETIEMIRRRLESKDSFPAIQFGYFLMNRQVMAMSGKFVNLSIRQIHFAGYTLYTTAYSKLFGSCRAMKLLRMAIVYGTRGIGKWKMSDSFFADHNISKR